METFPVTKSQERRMEVGEMRLLRFVNCLTCMDRVRNDKVRADLGTAQIGLKPKQLRLRWYGHMLRRKKMLSSCRGGGEEEDQKGGIVKEDMKELGLDVNDTQTGRG